MRVVSINSFFFFQAEDGIRDGHVTGVQTCALPIWLKLAVPIMLAWYFRKQQQPRVGLVDLLVALLILFIPFFLIVRQPDLGTEIGRASCRERVKISGGGVQITEKGREK